MQSTSTFMKLLGNKNVQFKTDLIEWNQKIDLLALSNEKGEVMIQRLKWQKVWILSPPEENVTVRAISWRSDEKILSIAYSSGLILLIDVETKDEIHSTKLNKDIKCMCWTQNFVEIDENDIAILDQHKIYLANLTNLNSLSSTVKKQDYNYSKICSKNMLNFLIVGLASGLVKLYIFGVLSCGTIDIKKELNLAVDEEINILNVRLSNDFKHLHVVFERSGNVEMLIYENPILLTHQVPLWNIAIKYSHILNYLSYIDDTIQCIVEAWEKVLLEMDNKLSKYAKTKEKGTVSADFLELLLFGVPSQDLDVFLTRDLTEKELKKLGNSIELSYCTIQKLVVKPLHTAIINLFYHVNHIMGLQQNAFYYKELLGEFNNESLINTGAFLIKSYELQQTIDSSTRDYKIFFRWLYVVIMRLLDESIPDDIANFSQQEITYLADFLYDLEKHVEENNADGVVEMNFNLERVGQYLVDKNLIIPLKMDVNGMWDKLLEENECLKKSHMIFPHNRNLSLVQQRNLMKKGINDLFGKLEDTIGGKFDLKYHKTLDSNNFEHKSLISSHINIERDGKDYSFFTVLTAPTKILLIEAGDNSLKHVLLTVKEEDASKYNFEGQLNFVDVKFYNSANISILTRNLIGTKNISCLFQLPIAYLEVVWKTTEPEEISFYKLIEECSVKVLEGLEAVSMAVSGSRKVASFLDSNRKIIRLYETEIDEDDDEMEGNSSFDNN